MAVTAVDAVGRDEEVASLDALLKAAPGALVLLGQPGIGKTTLVRHAVATAHRSGFFVRWRPVTAIRALLDPYLDAAPGDALVPGVPVGAFGHQRGCGVGARLVLRRRDLVRGHRPDCPESSATSRRFSDAVLQSEDARIYAGFHFRFSCVDGATLWAAVAGYVVGNVALPLHGRQVRQLGG